MKTLFCLAVLSLFLLVPIGNAGDIIIHNYPSDVRVRGKAQAPVVLPVEVSRQITGGSGCYGQRAGCYGQRAGCVGYTIQANGCVGGGRSGYATPVGIVYSQPAIPYGARMSDGRYYTPSGRQPGPGIFGVPGAPWGLANGPVREMIREKMGRDPGAPVFGFGSGY